MSAIGFSTGAVAYSDFQRALAILRPFRFSAIELSALREHELPRLVEALPEIDLTGYRYVSFHAPSSTSDEKKMLSLLERVVARNIPVVVHPNVINDIQCWKAFGEMLLIENMDKRKPVGRTVEELLPFYDKLPDASFCFDIGHAKQVDPTLTEAYRILTRFRTKLKEVHISEVNTESKHKPLTHASELAFAKLSGLFPESLAVISEATGIEEASLPKELEFAKKILFDNQLMPA